MSMQQMRKRVDAIQAKALPGEGRLGNDHRDVPGNVETGSGGLPHEDGR